MRCVCEGVCSCVYGCTRAVRCGKFALKIMLTSLGWSACVGAGGGERERGRMFECMFTC